MGIVGPTRGQLHVDRVLRNRQPLRRRKRQHPPDQRAVDSAIVVCAVGRLGHSPRIAPGEPHLQYFETSGTGVALNRSGLGVMSGVVTYPVPPSAGTASPAWANVESLFES